MEELKKQLLEAFKKSIRETIEPLEREIEKLRDENESLSNSIEERLKSLKDGKDGKDGRDGRDGKDGSNGLNGKDGINGKNGASAYEIAVSQGYSGTLLEFAQKQFGKDGRDGKDGLGFDDIKVEFDGQRTINLKFEADGNVKSYSFDIPAQIYRGVYQSGVKYKTGDTVTDNGSLWSCLKDTEERPVSSISGSWQLAVKHGRAGVKGECGDSAYDLAVKGGFSGSQKDWLAEIRRGRQV